MSLTRASWAHIRVYVRTAAFFGALKKKRRGLLSFKYAVQASTVDPVALVPEGLKKLHT